MSNEITEEPLEPTEEQRIQLHQAFRIYDHDGDECITSYQLQNLLRSLIQNDDELEYVIDTSNPNQSHITFQQFLDLLGDHFQSMLPIHSAYELEREAEPLRSFPNGCPPLLENNLTSFTQNVNCGRILRKLACDMPSRVRDRMDLVVMELISEKVKKIDEWFLERLVESGNSESLALLKDDNPGELALLPSSLIDKLEEIDIYLKIAIRSRSYMESRHGTSAQEIAQSESLIKNLIELKANLISGYMETLKKPGNPLQFVAGLAGCVMVAFGAFVGMYAAKRKQKELDKFIARFGIKFLISQLQFVFNRLR